MEIRRGDIWYVKLEGNKHSIQGGERPCIIISNDANNRFSPTVQVLPMTKQIKNMLPVHIKISKEIGLLFDSTLLPEQFTTVGKPMLLEYVCKCDEELMKEVEKVVMIQTGIITPHTDLKHIDRIINKITDIDRFVTKCIARGLNLNYEDELMDRSFLIGELIAYCKHHNIDYKQLLVKKGLIRTNNRENLRRAL